MNKRRTIYIVLVAIIAFVLSGGYWWWNTEGQYRGIEFVPGDPDISSPDKYTRYYEALKKAYAEDTYGGDTPEETLELFIDALRQGDVDLASKYFVVEEQKEKQSEFFKAGDNLSWYIDILEQRKELTYNDSFKTYEAVSQYAGEDVFLFNIVLNTQTNKWKISDL